MRYLEISTLIVNDWWVQLLNFLNNLVNWCAENWVTLVGVSIPVLLGVVLLKVLL